MEKTAFIEGGVVPWSSLVLRLGKVPLTRLSVSRTSMERSKKKALPYKLDQHCVSVVLM